MFNHKAHKGKHKAHKVLLIININFASFVFSFVCFVVKKTFMRQPHIHVIKCVGLQGSMKVSL